MLNRITNGLLGTVYFPIRAILHILYSPLIAIYTGVYLSAGIVLFNNDNDNLFKRLFKIGGLTPVACLTMFISSLPIRLLGFLISPVVGFIAGFDQNESIGLPLYRMPLCQTLHNALDTQILRQISKWVGYRGDLQEYSQLFRMYWNDYKNKRDFNRDNNTHSASVHKSAQQSAKKLMVRYQKALSNQGEDSILEGLLKWLSKNHYGSIKNESAKRCLQQLTAYQEPNTKITLKRLLAMAWLAVNDKTVVTNTENGCLYLLEGLYEIQRGNNLDAKGIDNELVDSPICSSGAFNKLIEKLTSIHPDASIIYLTVYNATKKLPRVVLKETKFYLKNLPNPISEKEINERNQLITDIIRGHEDIWEKIAGAVSKQMSDEFGDLFDSNRRESFSEFIEAGRYTNLKEEDFSDLRPIIKVYPSPLVTARPSSLSVVVEKQNITAQRA